MRNYNRVVFLPDIHVPYQEEGVLQTALAFVKYFKPHTVFIMGDLLDFMGLARFDNKDPKKLFRLQGEIREGKDILQRIRLSSGNSRMFFIRGNHEYRLTKYIRNNAPELHDLESLSLPKLLGTDEIDIEYVEDGIMEFNGLLVKHGDVVRKKAGYTATAEMEDTGVSGISGHTHRLAQVYRTNRGGMSTWIEAGCLCDLNPDWMEGKITNWQHGLAYGWYTKNRDKRFVIHTLPIINNKILFEGREIHG